MHQNQWKKSEKDLDDTESTRNEDYDDDKTLKTTMLYLTEINKNIREIKKEIVMKTKYLEIWILHLIQKKIVMNLKKLWVLLIIITCNMKSLEMNRKIYQSKNILILSDHFKWYKK